MASLTQVAYYTKKIIKWGIILSVSLIIFKVGFTVVKDIYQKIYPPPPPPPTVSFDKLPRIEFPQEEQPTGLSFTLETPTGELPDLGEQAKVYLSPYQRPNLLALDRAKEEASQLGFTSEPKKISEKKYRWLRNEPTNPTLEMDIFSGAFTYGYDWQNDALLFDEKYLPNKEQAIKEAKNFLKKMQRLETDLEEGRSEATYLKLMGTKLTPAPSLSEADLVRVEIFRKGVEEVPALTANPDKGLVSFLILGTSGANKRMAEVEFNYFPVNYESLATYPIKNSGQAWEELKNGQGFVSSLDEGVEKIVVRRVYLGYFDSWEPQEYLQPIFVFQGDNNFLGLVPAVTGEWLK
jgi:hypothetical protein